MPSPFSDLRTTKKRPVLVIYKDSFNENNLDILSCFITSNIYKDKKHSIQLTKEDFEKGKFEFKSIIKPQRIFTLDKNLFYIKLATIKKTKYEKIYDKILELISIE